MRQNIAKRIFRHEDSIIGAESANLEDIMVGLLQVDSSLISIC
jgi:hypothetical protein